MRLRKHTNIRDRGSAAISNRRAFSACVLWLMAMQLYGYVRLSGEMSLAGAFCQSSITVAFYPLSLVQFRYAFFGRRSQISRRANLSSTLCLSQSTGEKLFRDAQV